MNMLFKCFRFISSVLYFALVVFLYLTVKLLCNVDAWVAEETIM